jgi:glyoxylase-like metal-dependent hydrolase (beta-lactamase superfamily II)
VRVHHLNCGTMCPLGSKQMGGRLGPAELVAHCLLIEAGAELILVDTGYGTGDIANPKRLGRPFLAMMRPRFRDEDTAIAQVRALGFDPADVRHVIATHLDLDHAGGLGDFPDAQVHLYRSELEAATHPSLRERARYIKKQLGPQTKWAPHDVSGERWFGFESVRPLESTGEDIALVPLVGHSRGHTGVAVRDDRGWMLHCGDAYFDTHEMETPPKGAAGLEIFQKLVQFSGSDRHHNQDRLRELAAAHGDEVRLFCSHDPRELQREAAAAAPAA